MKKQIWLDGAAIVTGTAMIAAAYDIFVLPNRFSPGGVSGLAAVLATFIPVSVGILSFLINLPLIVMTWKTLGIKLLSRTFAATLCLSVWLDVLATVLPAYHGNPLLAAGLGGVIAGLGCGVLLLRGISTGGTDLLSILLVHRFPNLPVGKLLMLIDATVVAIAVLVFRDVEIALYSFIVIVANSKMIDTVIDGANYAKVIYCITDQSEAVVKAITEHTIRGTTVADVYGGYTGDSKKMVITVTRQNVLAETLALLKEADPGAFTFVVNAAEVHGEGFKRYRADSIQEDSQKIG